MPASFQRSPNAVSREEATSTAPAARTRSHLLALAVPYTSAPSQRATCTAAVPTPPAAAWISTLSPGPTRPRSTSAYHAVRNANGTPAATVSDRPAGVGATIRASVVT
jgi:hypothetical protein